MKTRILLAGALLAACSTPPPPPAPPAPQPTAPPPADQAKDPALADLASPIEAWRAKPPTSGPRPELSLPTFERAETKSGLSVMVASRKTLPLVALSVVTKGGAATDPKGKAGLTALAYDLLGEGAGKLDAMAFSDAVADLGASFSVAGDTDSGSITIYGLSEHREAMMQLLADVLLRPRLGRKDFDRIKNQRLADLARAKGSPAQLAFEHVPAMVYGADHPYGHPGKGTEATVKGLSLQDVKKQLKAVLRPTASAFVATGDIDVEEAKRLASKYLANFRGPKGAPPKRPPVAPKPRAKIKLIHKAPAPQTMVVLARPIFGRGDPDEHNLEVTNTVFGGSFTSRLNMNLREKKGYTYGARSVVSPRRGVGALYAYAMIRQDATAPALAEFIRDLAGMQTEPVQGDELERAKNSMVRSLPGDFETISSMAGAASSIYVYDLPLDYFAQLPARIETVTGGVTVEMAKRYLDPSLMQILLVGDADAILESVKELDLGEVEVVRSEGGA